MLAKIEALNYCCLKYISRELLPFHVLVGPNASGKSTFLDVVGFLADFLSEGAEAAVMKRASTLNDLFFRKTGTHFELAIEVNIPPESIPAGKNGKYKRCRYEIAIGKSDNNGELQIRGETFWLMSGSDGGKKAGEEQRELFPSEPQHPATILQPRRSQPGWRKIVNKPESGNDYFHSETTDWNFSLRIAPRKSALANVPEDTEKFPVATWLKSLLMEGVQRLALDVKSMRQPCSPIEPSFFLPNGSNLPLVLRRLKQDNPKKFQEWLAHIQTVLADIQDIEIVEREEDRHLYLVAKYSNNIRVSSWRLSDGTLRFLALTLLPYLPGTNRIYLIEEPENGIHPVAIDAVFQSLSSVYDGQVLVATHSPLILAQADLENILCFAKTEEGATDIVSGSKHPRLQDWKKKKEESLAVLYAAGVLG